MSIDALKRITILPTRPPIEPEQRPPNTARDVQSFVGNFISVVSAPLDFANLGVAHATNWISNALPAFPAARILQFWGEMKKLMDVAINVGVTAIGVGSTAAMGAIGVAAAETDQKFYLERVNEVESESESAAAARRIGDSLQLRS